MLPVLLWLLVSDPGELELLLSELGLELEELLRLLGLEDELLSLEELVTPRLLWLDELLVPRLLWLEGELDELDWLLGELELDEELDGLLGLEELEELWLDAEEGVDSLLLSSAGPGWNEASDEACSRFMTCTRLVGVTLSSHVAKSPACRGNWVALSMASNSSRRRNSGSNPFRSSTTTRHLKHGVRLVWLASNWAPGWSNSRSRYSPGATLPPGSTLTIPFLESASKSSPSESAPVADAHTRRLRRP